MLLKVTIVCDVLGEANNGTTIATLNLIKYLLSQGHQVKVVSNDFEGSGVPSECQCILPTLSLGKLADGIIARNGVSLARNDKKIMYDAIKWADVVHIQMPLAMGRTGVSVARRLHKPITASFHCQAENVSTHVGLENFEYISKLIYKDFHHNMYKYCNAVHYPTKFIKNTFENACSRRTNAYVISNGVNTIYCNHHEQRSYESGGKFVIACTGRFSTEKAQHLLIEAAAKSRHKDIIQLKFAGEGPLKEKYMEQAQALGVDADFSFYTRQALVDMLNTADLYVHCAFIEIEAISCMEAISCGLVPVIANAHRSATVAFALDDKSLFKENDSDDLAAKIDFWIDNPEVKKEYVEKYKDVAAQFEQTECMKKMEQMLIETYDNY